ncbi:MAG: hypothetical protein MUC63_05950 [Planctomycetes bacterium]|nr:hypothetical protein [Planctomycetota bacterium]
MRWVLYILIAAAILALAALEVALIVVPELPREEPVFREPQSATGGLPASGAPGSWARVKAAGERPQELSGVALVRDDLGVMSVDRAETGEFTFFAGKGKVSVPFGKIRRIDVDGVRVRVTGADGRVMEGTADARAAYSIAGFLSDQKTDTALRIVESAEFRHPPEGEGPRCGSCGKPLGDPAWRYCPFDGKRLSPARPDGPGPRSGGGGSSNDGEPLHSGARERSR